MICRFTITEEEHLKNARTVNPIWLLVEDEAGNITSHTISHRGKLQSK